MVNVRRGAPPTAAHEDWAPGDRPRLSRLGRWTRGKRSTTERVIVTATCTTDRGPQVLRLHGRPVVRFGLRKWAWEAVIDGVSRFGETIGKRIPEDFAHCIHRWGQTRLGARPVGVDRLREALADARDMADRIGRNQRVRDDDARDLAQRLAVLDTDLRAAPAGPRGTHVRLPTVTPKRAPKVRHVPKGRGRATR